MDTEVVGLGRYWSTIRRRRWIVLAFVLVFVVAVSAYVETRPAKYEATAQVLLKPYSPFSQTPLTTGQVDTQVQVMGSLQIVRPVLESQHLDESVTTLQKSISVSSVGDTSVIEITVSRSHATQAADIANALANQYLEFRKSDLPKNARSNFAKVITFAQPPQHQSGPSLLVAGLLGLVVGLILGCGAALVIERRDESVTDESSINDLVGRLPVVGRIPVAKRRARPYLVEGRSSREGIAYRFLATTVRLLRQEHQAGSLGGGPTVIVVASAAPRDGRTTVAANLAFDAAEGGQNVVLVDADLTQPGLTRLLDLQRDVTVESLLRRPVSLGLDLLTAPAPGLHAIGSSSAFSGQSALVGDGRFRGLVGRLPATVDLVVVDTSPLLSAPEVLDLIPQADVVLLVVRERFTKGPDLTAALERIRQVGGVITGVVVTGSYASPGTQRTSRRRIAPSIPSRKPAASEEPDSAAATEASKR